MASQKQFVLQVSWPSPWTEYFMFKRLFFNAPGQVMKNNHAGPRGQMHFDTKQDQLCQDSRSYRPWRRHHVARLCKKALPCWFKEDLFKVAFLQKMKAHSREIRDLLSFSVRRAPGSEFKRVVWNAKQAAFERRIVCESRKWVQISQRQAKKSLDQIWRDQLGHHPGDPQKKAQACERILFEDPAINSRTWLYILMRSVTLYALNCDFLCQSS